MKLAPKRGHKAHDMLAVPEKCCLKRCHLMVWQTNLKPLPPPTKKNPARQFQEDKDVVVLSFQCHSGWLGEMGRI